MGSFEDGLSFMTCINKTSDIADLTHLKWDWGGVSFGSAGTLPKAIDRTCKPNLFYKTSKYNLSDGFIGMEAIYEVVCFRILTQLGMPVIQQDLQKAKILFRGKEYVTFICVSKDFSRKGFSRITFERLLGDTDYSPFDYAVNSEFLTFFVDMILCDYIICNSDRHGANIEFYVCEDFKLPVPLFDNGSSLMLQCRDKSQFGLYKYEDPYTNSIFGCTTHSKLLNKFYPYLGATGLKWDMDLNWDLIFMGLGECLSEVYQTGIKELVEYRLSYIKSIMR